MEKICGNCEYTVEMIACRTVEQPSRNIWVCPDCDMSFDQAGYEGLELNEVEEEGDEGEEADK